MARNDIWSMDFVAEELTDGRRFRTLTVLDLFTRGSNIEVLITFIRRVGV
jgi:hypothetical protein